MKQFEILNLNSHQMLHFMLDFLTDERVIARECARLGSHVKERDQKLQTEIRLNMCMGKSGIFPLFDSDLYNQAKLKELKPRNARRVFLSIARQSNNVRTFYLSVLYWLKRHNAFQHLAVGMFNGILVILCALLM